MWGCDGMLLGSLAADDVASLRRVEGGGICAVRSFVDGVGSH